MRFGVSDLIPSRETTNCHQKRMINDRLLLKCCDGSFDGANWLKGSQICLGGSRGEVERQLNGCGEIDWHKKMLKLESRSWGFGRWAITMWRWVNEVWWGGSWIDTGKWLDKGKMVRKEKNKMRKKKHKGKRKRDNIFWTIYIFKTLWEQSVSQRSE